MPNLICANCHRAFSARAHNAKTCSDTCRQQLYRLRQKRKDTARAQTWSIPEQNRLQNIQLISSASAYRLEAIRQKWGREVALQCLIAIEDAIQVISKNLAEDT